MISEIRSEVQGLSEKKLSPQEAFRLERSKHITNKVPVYLEMITANDPFAKNLQNRLQAMYLRYEERKQLEGQPITRSFQDLQRFVAELLAQFDFGIKAAGEKAAAFIPTEKVKLFIYDDHRDEPSIASYAYGKSTVLVNLLLIMKAAEVEFLNNTVHMGSIRNEQAIPAADMYFFAGVEEFSHYLFDIVKDLENQAEAPQGLNHEEFSEGELRAARWITYFEKMLGVDYGMKAIAESRMKIVKAHPDYEQMQAKIRNRQKSMAMQRKLFAPIMNLVKKLRRS